MSTGVDGGAQAPGESARPRLRYLTVAEVAESMRVSRMTVYRLVHGGELPAVQVGRSYRVPQDALDAFLAQSSVDRARMSS